MEEEKLKVTIEADASNTKDEADKAISALNKVRNAYKNMMSKLKLDASSGIKDLIGSLSKSMDKTLSKGSDGLIVGELKKQVEQLKKELEDSSGSSKGVEKSMKGVLLAMRAVNATIHTITRSMNYYLSQNDDLRAKLNGCYYALGSLFAPVLEYLIKLFSNLLAIVNALIRGLGFAGINMKKYGKAAGSAAKQMKQLAGFDEINNLNNSSGGGGGVGIADPLAGIDKNAKWLTWIEEHAKGILNTIVMIAATIGSFMNNLKLVKGLGIAVTFKGIYDTVKAIGDIFKNGWNLGNISKLLKGIGESIVGLSVLSGNWVGVLVGGITLVSSYVVEHWDSIKSKIIDGWNKIKDIFDQVIGGLKLGWANFCNGLKTTLSTAWSKIISVFSGGGGGFKAITDGISSVLKTYVNKLINGINSVIAKPFSSIQSMMTKLRNWKIAGMQPFRNIPYISIPRIPTLATGGFPEDGLFFANSGELVGKFANGNTAVVNNEQILKGIESAVRRGMTSDSDGSIDTDRPIIIELDGKTISRTVIKNINQLSKIEGVRLV